jgi:hypothetical protein
MSVASLSSLSVESTTSTATVGRGGGNVGGSKVNVGAIAGGVAGGVAGLSLLALFGFFFAKRGEGDARVEDNQEEGGGEEKPSHEPSLPDAGFGGAGVGKDPSALGMQMHPAYAGAAGHGAAGYYLDQSGGGYYSGEEVGRDLQPLPQSISYMSQAAASGTLHSDQPYSPPNHEPGSGSGTGTGTGISPGDPRISDGTGAGTGAGTSLPHAEQDGSYSPTGLSESGDTNNPRPRPLPLPGQSVGSPRMQGWSGLPEIQSS